MEPINLFGLLIYGCTSKDTLLPILKFQKESLRPNIFKNNFSSRVSLSEQCGLLKVFENYALELSKLALASIQGQHMSNFVKFSRSKNTKYLDMQNVASGSSKPPPQSSAQEKNY